MNDNKTITILAANEEFSGTILQNTEKDLLKAFGFSYNEKKDLWKKMVSLTEAQQMLKTNRISVHIHGIISRAIRRAKRAAERKEGK